MDKTKEEIHKEQFLANGFDTKYFKFMKSMYFDSCFKSAHDAMEVYAEQEAKSFAQFLLTADGSKPINELWKEYRND